MKHGWHQTVNDVVYCYQTPFTVALIVEQVSNYKNALREQAIMEKSEHRIQDNAISDNNIVVTIISATTKDNVPNGLEDENLKN